MTWSKFDDQARTHAKVRKAGNEAANLWWASIIYSNTYLTDGFIADDQITSLLPNPIPRKTAEELAKRLTQAVVRQGGKGLWEIVEGGYLVHDFDQWNPKAEETRARREADRKRKAASRSGPRGHAAESNGTPNGQAPPRPSGIQPASERTANGQDAESSRAQAPPRAPARPRPVPSRPSAAAHNTSATPPDALEAIRQELASDPTCRALPLDEVAHMLEQRFRTIEIARGVRLEWVLQAIRDGAADGLTLNAQALTAQLRRYVDHARAPRPDRADNHDAEDREDEQERDELAEEAKRLAKAPGSMPTPERRAEMKRKLLGGSNG